MKKITALLLITISLFVFTSCKEDEKDIINYIGFESAVFDFGVDLDSSSSREIKVYTTTTSSSERTFNLNVLTDLSSADPASYTVPASVTVPANSNVGAFAVTISDTNIGPDGKTLALEFGSLDGLFTSEPIILNITQICPFNEVVLDITFDNYSEETSWELRDSSNNQIDSGSYGAGVVDISKDLCLPSGSYTFIIYDAYADGMCCSFGMGSYSLSTSTNVLASGGSFGASESTSFTLP